MFRKVTKTGPATLTIALPAKWAKEQKLSAGNFIELEEFETHLRISKTFEKNPGLIKIPYNELLIENMLEKLFLESEDTIIIYSEDDLPKLDHLIKKFPGLKIIEQEKNKLVIERTLKPSIKNSKALLRRVYLLIKESLRSNPPIFHEIKDILFLLELDQRTKEVFLLKEVVDNITFDSPIDDDVYGLIKNIFRLLYKQKYSFVSSDSKRLFNYFKNSIQVFNNKKGDEILRLYHIVKVLKQLYKELIYQQSIEVLSKSSKQEKRFKVGVCLKNQSNAFWVVDVKESIEERAKNLDIEFIFEAPLIHKGVNKQEQILNNFIQDKVDAIIYAPIDPTKLKTIISRINQEKIPLLVLDTDLEFKADFDFIGFDNYKGGELTAEYLSKYLNKKSNILVIEGETKGNFTQRTIGFKDKLKDHKIDIYVGKFQKKLSYDLALKHLKDKDAVFATSDNMALGVVKAMKKLDLDIPICGFDRTEEGFEALNKGLLFSTVDTKPKTMGSLAVEHINNLLHKKPVAKRTEYDIELVTSRRVI